MKTVTKRELNQNTAQVLADVEAGDAVLVTERGVPRWYIEAVGAFVDPVARLRAAGRITPPRKHRQPWPVDEPHYTPAQIEAIYAESCSER